MCRCRDLDGFQVIKKLVDKKHPLPQIVFATAFDQYAVRAFEVNAVDYLLKPFDKKRVAQSVDKARQKLAGPTSSERLESLINLLEQQQKPQQQKVLLRSAGRLILVDQKDICFATIDEGIITVATSSMEGHSNCRTLEELQESLDPNLFWRAHRSHVVNINRIKEVLALVQELIPASHGRSQAQRASREPGANEAVERAVWFVKPAEVRSRSSRCKRSNAAALSKLAAVKFTVCV